jgi:hypothetical protein
MPNQVLLARKRLAAGGAGERPLTRVQLAVLEEVLFSPKYLKSK